jgi:hypothetical protein
MTRIIRRRKSITQGPGRDINLKIALMNQAPQIEKTHLE